MASLRPLPETDAYAEAFWKGVSDGQLLIQRCKSCGHHQHYARPFCLKCRAGALEMVPASGKGSIYSFTVINRSPYEDLPAPYAVALVRLEEGVTLLSQIVDCDPGELRCDLPVEVSFQPLRDGVTLPVFRLARPSSYS
jgi:uncharacterized OB-fold protein